MIVFDLDGTLVDSAPEILAALEHAWAAIESGPFPRERFHIGPPLGQMVQTAGATDPEALIAAFRARYDASDFTATRPFPGILELLDRLGPVAGRLAVATNKRLVPTQKILARWFGGRFAQVACSDGLANAQGAPKGAYSKAEMLTALGATVLVGDTVADVEAARQAGVRAVAVTWGYDPATALERAQPDALVSDPAALLLALTSAP